MNDQMMWQDVKVVQAGGGLRDYRTLGVHLESKLYILYQIFMVTKLF